MTKLNSVRRSLELYLATHSTVTGRELMEFHRERTGLETMSACREIRYAKYNEGNKPALIHIDGAWEQSSTGARYMRYYKL